MQDFLERLKQRVVVYDGAMGTNIQTQSPTLDDFWGKEGCNELLVLSQPKIIQSIHSSFLEAGCDVIETDSFGSSRIVLAEYELEDRTRELNIAAAQLAREVAQGYSTPERPRYVAGSMGPTTKLPSLGHISYDSMAEAYREQASALIEGGVDILLIETCQDLLQAKIALAACQDAMHDAGRRLPVQMQVTLEATGTMLLGSEIGAALAVIGCFRPDIVGLNCATGPVEMNDAVRFLCQNATSPVSVLPNAGLPQNVGGHAVYHLTPAELASHHRRFVSEYGVQVVGGCCGTTPEHLRAVVEAVRDITPAVRDVRPQSVAASAFSALPLEVDGQPVVIAEEMNTTTRVENFRNMVRGGDYDGILALAKKLVAEGSQMLDLCCAVVGEDEKAYMNAVLEKIATRVPAPIVIDSTEADVVEEALKRIPGKPVINSVNLEDGEKRTSKVLPMARRYGAAVVALTIDEDGMALTAEKKLAVAKRIYKLATEKYGLRGQDILFDPLTLPISTGQEEYYTAGMETLEAIRLIKRELPEAKTILGVSNISFGLSAYSRRVLNSVFLKEAVDRGLDAAIVNYTKIYPLYKIPEREVELARKLIFRNGGPADGDPLQTYMAYFGAQSKSAGPAEDEQAVEALSVEDKLKQLIIRGEKSIGHGSDKKTLIEVLDEALGTYTPLDLINNVLLDGMKTVGELFGARKMQLPSVLDSAGVMKAAVAYLEPMMEKLDGAQKGIVVLATVKGDVHDIGKNLVDIILSNNGYKVVNLGIKQTADAIIQSAREHHADAIGLSGLLVKSTLEMKYVIQDLERMNLGYPVICGGAALTRKYVEEDLRKEYSSAVFYADDAFTGLHVMGDLTSQEEARTRRMDEGKTVKVHTRVTVQADAPPQPISMVRSAIVERVAEIPQAPFYGPRVKQDFHLPEVFRYINETALFKNQWQLKTASAADYPRLVEEKYRPILMELMQEIEARQWFEPKAVYGFFPAQSEGNDLIVYEPPVNGNGTHGGLKEKLRITFPRQREGRKLSIADFFEPVDSGKMDVAGFAIVTIGARASQETKKLFDSGDFTRYLYVHGLSVETAEALAELTHKIARQDLGIGGEDSPNVKDLFHQKYHGSRYSFGFAACPNLEDQAKIFALLEPEERIGVRLTEGFLQEPEQSTNAIIVHHPQAKYFSA